MSDMEDLFGSDDDDAGQQAPAQQQPQRDELEDDLSEDEAAVGAPRGASQRGPTYDEEAELFGSDEEAPGPSVRYSEPIDVVAPMAPRHPSDKLHLLKLTNIVGLEKKPWDPATFEGGLEHYRDDRGATRARLKDSNIIRWRMARGADGRLVPESNARLVRWSDGSTQLLLGDEPLDVANTDVSGCVVVVAQWRVSGGVRLAWRAMHGRTCGHSHGARHGGRTAAPLAAASVHSMVTSSHFSKHTSLVCRSGSLGHPHMRTHCATSSPHILTTPAL